MPCPWAASPHTALWSPNVGDLTGASDKVCLNKCHGTCSYIFQMSLCDGVFFLMKEVQCYDFMKEIF